MLIFDEVQKIKDINNFFDYLNFIYRQTGVPIIIISNKRTIIDDMPIDAKKTLIFEKINFPSYNALELQDIVKDRLKMMKDEPILKRIPEGFVEYVCSKEAKEGSARTTLLIIMRCILSNNFSEEFINKINKDQEKEDWTEFINSLTKLEKTFLNALIEIYIKDLKKPITASQIRENMGIIPQRISQLITTFEKDYGIIKTEYQNLGRGKGRYRIIDFVSQEIFVKLEGLV